MGSAGQEFDEHPFVAGKIRGLRSFRVPPEGNRLTGCTFPIDWNPNVNYAAHIGPLLGGGPANWVKFREEWTNHEVGGRGCACGYYGFVDGSNDYDYYSSSVTGIIEGYGTVTIGTRGFRASKAKIVALIDDKATSGLPPVQGDLDRFAGLVVANKDWVGVIAGLLSFAVASIGIAASLWPLVVAGFAMSIGTALGLLAAVRRVNLVREKFGEWILREASAKRRPRSPHLDKLLAHEHWRGIPVFRSKEEALKAFPLGMVGPDA